MPKYCSDEFLYQRSILSVSFTPKLEALESIGEPGISEFSYKRLIRGKNRVGILFLIIEFAVQPKTLNKRLSHCVGENMNSFCGFDVVTQTRWLQRSGFESRMFRFSPSLKNGLLLLQTILLDCHFQLCRRENRICNIAVVKLYSNRFKFRQIEIF